MARVGVRGCCRITPPRFLAKCPRRRLNQGSFVSAVCLVVIFFDLYCVYVCIFVIYIQVFLYCRFVNNSQVIGCEDRPEMTYTVSGGA